MNNIEFVLRSIGAYNHFDAKYTAVLEQKLEYLKTKVYEIQYPEFMARQLIPVSNEADSGAETITYQEDDAKGEAIIVANYADDIPLVDSLSEKFPQRVHSIASAYQYSIQDLRRSAMSGADLPMRRARVTRRVFEQKIDDIGATGSANHGLFGIANNANVTLTTPDTGTWSTASAAQIIGDMNKHVRSVVDATKGVWVPDTLAYSVELFNILTTTRVSTTGDTNKSIYTDYLESSPYIKQIVAWNKLALADAAGTGPRAICYKKDPDVLSLEIPQEYEALPAQAKNLAFVVPTHGRTAGVIMPVPVAIRYMDGL